MGIKEGRQDPFHYREELIIQSFNARITGMLYTQLRGKTNLQDRDGVNKYLKQLRPATLLGYIESIRKLIFTQEAQRPVETDETNQDFKDKTRDQHFLGHARFICYMETYLTLKHSIRYADIGTISRLFPRFALLFFGGRKIKYGILSLYMIWLTRTDATTSILRKAILSNGLVNLRGAPDSWFEMDRLNEFLNLSMKRIMTSRRSSTQELHELFKRTALSANYATSLHTQMGYLREQYIGGQHTAKEASIDLYRLALHLCQSNSVFCFSRGRISEHIPSDLIHIAVGPLLSEKIAAFNSNQIADEALEEPDTTPISSLDDIMTDDYGF